MPSFGCGVSTSKLNMTGKSTSTSMPHDKACMEFGEERASLSENLDRSRSSRNEYFFPEGCGNSGGALSNWLLEQFEDYAIEYGKAHKPKKDGSPRRPPISTTIGLGIVVTPDEEAVAQWPAWLRRKFVDDSREVIEKWLCRPLDAYAKHVDEGAIEERGLTRDDELGDDGLHWHGLGRMPDLIPDRELLVKYLGEKGAQNFIDRYDGENDGCLYRTGNVMKAGRLQLLHKMFAGEMAERGWREPTDENDLEATGWSVEPHVSSAEKHEREKQGEVFPEAGRSANKYARQARWERKKKAEQAELESGQAKLAKEQAALADDQAALESDREQLDSDRAQLEDDRVQLDADRRVLLDEQAQFKTDAERDAAARESGYFPALDKHGKKTIIALPVSDVGRANLTDPDSCAEAADRLLRRIRTKYKVGQGPADGRIIIGEFVPGYLFREALVAGREADVTKREAAADEREREAEQAVSEARAVVDASRRHDAEVEDWWADAKRTLRKSAQQLAKDVHRFLGKAARQFQSSRSDLVRGIGETFAKAAYQWGIHISSAGAFANNPALAQIFDDDDHDEWQRVEDAKPASLDDELMGVFDEMRGPKSSTGKARANAQQVQAQRVSFAERWGIDIDEVDTTPSTTDYDEPDF